MQKKRLMAMVVAMCLVSLVMLPLVATDAAAKGLKTYKLTLATPLPKTHISTYPAIHFAKFVNENCVTADGRVEINWAFGPEGIHAKDQFSAVQTGTVDVAQLFSVYIQGEVPEVKICNAPGVWDLQNWQKLWNAGVAKILSDALRKHGLVLLGQANVMPFILFTTKPFSSLSDLKGRVFRGSGRPITDIVKYVGGSATRLASSEVYPAMQRGVIDGAVQGITSYAQYGYWNIAPYVLDYYLNSVSGLMTINLNKFNSLPPSLQKKLLQLGSQHNNWITEYWTGVLKHIADQMKQHKVKFVTLSKEKKETLDKALLEIYRKQVLNETPKANEAFFKILKREGKSY